MPTADRPMGPERALENARWMAALARRLVGAADADDVVQDTWLTFLARPPRDAAAAGGWLRRVLSNLALRSRRGRARRAAREEAAARAEAQPEDAGDIVERAELLQRLGELVLKLDEPYRSTLLLRYFEDLRPVEIARRQAVPLDTVYTRLRRSIAELRRRLDGEHGGSRQAWLTVLLPLAAVPLALPAPAAAASVSVSPTTTATLVSGGLVLASKKVALIASLAAALFLTFGGVALWLQSVSGRADLPDEASVAHAPAAGEDSAAALAVLAPPSVESQAPAPSPAIASAQSSALLWGRVTGDREQPIAGAMVVAVPLNDWEERATLELRGLDRAQDRDISADVAAAFRRLRGAAGELPGARSDAAGEYRFDTLAPGEHRLLAWRQGFLPVPDTVVLVEGNSPLRCDLALTPALEIRGRVVGDGGQPVAHARILWRESGWRRASDDERRARLFRRLEAASFLVEAEPVESAADGGFVISTLAPGLHDLLVIKEGLEPGRRFDVPAGGVAVEIVLERGLLVSGVVLAPDRAPVAGAGVRLIPAAASRRPSTAVGEPNRTSLTADVVFGEGGELSAVTDDRGAFTIAGVPPAAYTLKVAAEDYPVLRREIDVRAAADLSSLTLEAGGAIAGSVLSPEGVPVAGARVWVEDVPAGGISTWGGRFYSPPSLMEARTAVDGSFRLDPLRAGAYTVHAAAAEWTRRSLSSVRTGREDLTIELGAGVGVRGRVIDGSTGLPLAGAELAITGGLWRNAEAEKTSRSDAAGRFEIRGLTRVADHRLAIEATHTDFPGEKAAVEIPGRGDSAEIVLVLHPRQPLSGRVNDAAGRPVTQARVTAAVAGAPSCRSGEDGVFVLHLPHSARDHQRFEVTASHPTSGSGRTVVETPPEGREWPDAEVNVRLGSPLTGRVSGADGRAVAGAVIEARRQAGDLPQTAFSNEGGSYHLPRLEPGTYELEVRALGFAPAVVAAVTIEASDAGPAQTRDIVLERGLEVRGRVVDGDGRGIGAADVVVLDGLDLDGRDDFGTSPTRRDRRLTTAGMALARTQAEGEFTLRDLPARRLTLVGRASGFEPSPLVVVDATGSAEIEPVELVVTPFAGLSGHVEEAASSMPLTPFTVWLARQEGAGSAKTYLPREYDDPSGRFRFDDLGAGRHVVVVLVPGRPPAGEWVELRPGETAELRFRVEAGIAVTGRVTNADGGAPVAGASVFAFERGGWSQHLPLPTPFQAWTDAGGGFRLDGLAPAKYDLNVHHHSFASKVSRFEVEPGKDPAPVEVELHRAGDLAGRIAGIAARKAIWSSILLRPLDSPAKGERRFPIDARAETYTVRGIKPGRFEVHLHEQALGPQVAPDATAFKAEDMVERTLHLGEVEIIAGETQRFDAEVDPVESAR